MTDEQYKSISAQLERIATSIENIKARTKSVRLPKEPASDAGALKIMQLWNEHRNILFSKVQGLGPSSTRYKNATARWKEKPETVYWAGVINRINNSKFCCGDNERRWLADFEFLVRPDVHYRVLEGKYDFIGTSQKQPYVKKEKAIVGKTEDGLDVFG